MPRSTSAGVWQDEADFHLLRLRGTGDKRSAGRKHHDPFKHYFLPF
jgi:hypothetical protein